VNLARPRRIGPRSLRYKKARRATGCPGTPVVKREYLWQVVTLKKRDCRATPLESRTLSY